MKPADVVQAVFDAVRAGDVEAAAALFAEDCVLHMPEGTFEGREGVKRLRARRAQGNGPSSMAS
jgi:hypothetical protein